MTTEASGQAVITVRLPTTLHESLKAECHELQTSLNKLPLATRSASLKTDAANLRSPDGWMPDVERQPGGQTGISTLR